MSATLIKTDLPIMEAFYTIQGEGSHSGKAAYFIRVGGCDVGCVWCDVKESWNADVHPHKSLEEIVGGASKFPARLAVVTGGEPLMYDMFPLTSALKEEGFQTNIETSGAYKMSGAWDWVCFSPKKFKAPHDSIFGVANELKAIIYNKSDFKFAEKYAASVNSDCQLLLQPEWDREAEMLPLIIAYVKENPKWKISLQTHKYMEIP
ncbi:MAG: 7-carboxy-7-deazaguanine synthase [Algoriphagus sp.]|jgi:7-carboxy-7-deazaguanine synthase